MEIIRRNTDYALRALAYLAVKRGEVVPAAEIAESENVPIDYLHKILRKLARGGLVESTMGPGGGFALGREPGSITLLEAVELMQGKITMNRCALGRNRCPMSKGCVLKSTWLELEGKMVDFLEGITLEDIVDRLAGMPVV